MTAALVTLVLILAVAAAGLLVLVLVPTRKDAVPGGDGGILVSGSEGSVVTLRRVGSLTSVVIQGGAAVHDHWEGSEGVVPPPLSPDAARRYEPALYEEYMSPSTSAVRRYEIIDELYGLGFTLPYIKGLAEQYRREVAEALAGGDPDGRTLMESTPVNLTPEAGSAPARKLHINGELRHADIPEMGPADSTESPSNE